MPAASGVRLDFERVVPWRPYDPKVDCRWAARDLRRRHYTSKIARSTNLKLEVASWRLPLLARLVRQALNRGNVLEGPLRDRIADGGNPGCQGQVSTPSRPLAQVPSVELWPEVGDGMTG